MNNYHLFFLAIIAFALFTPHTQAADNQYIKQAYFDSDSSRNAELDQYWNNLSRTVREGDFIGYKEAYHEDAVVIFAVGKNKTSVSIAEALDNWKEGFLETKEGKRKDNVDFRFSQRLGNEDTAHETGIFHFTSKNSDGETTSNSYIHFEMLLVKRNGEWLSLMEYQKSIATAAEWEALK